MGSVVDVGVAAAGLHAESSAVCAVGVALTAFTSQSHGVSVGRLDPRRTARDLDGLVGPLHVIAGILEVRHHWAPVRPLLTKKKTNVIKRKSVLLKYIFIKVDFNIDSNL